MNLQFRKVTGTRSTWHAQAGEFAADVELHSYAYWPAYRVGEGSWHHGPDSDTLRDASAWCEAAYMKWQEATA